MTCAFTVMRRCLAALGLLAAPIAPALAQELYGMAGAQYTQDLRETSYAYSFEYLQQLGNYAFASFTWLNEGHVTDHHRDGYSPQLWLRWLGHERRFALAMGVGPYRYYDTTYVISTGRVTDAHDWGVLGSVAAMWYWRSPWVMQVRYNYARTTTSITTDSLLIGFGYQFEGSTRPGPWCRRTTTSVPRERGDDGDGRQQRGEQFPVAARRGLRGRIPPPAHPLPRRLGTALDEGDAHVVKRKGVAGQLGLMREFLNHHADVGSRAASTWRAIRITLPRRTVAGATRTQVLGLLSMTMTWRLTRMMHLRAYWDRTLTTNGRDTDVVLAGLGWSF